MSNSPSTSLSFDWAATFYDETRTLPDAIQADVAAAVAARLGHTSDPRLLEFGVGTGRIALPLLDAGLHLVGIDLSRAMMTRLWDKRQPPHRLALVQGDVTALPFADRAFDGIVIAHVLHLVPGWRDALEEARRALRPHGAVFHVWNWRDPESMRRQIRRRLHTLVQARGHSAARRGAQNDEEVAAALRAMGATVEDVEVARWERVMTAREIIDGLANRQFSVTRTLPEDVLAPAIASLREWAGDTFGDLDAPHAEEARFIWQVARFETGE